MERPLVAVINTDQQYLEMMAEFLDDEGYDTLILHENATTLDIIKQRMPALLLLELTITNPDTGWMVLNKLRLDPQTVRIPVIVAATNSGLLRRNEANLRAKHCDILLKPFDLEELLVMVGKYAPLPNR